MGVQFVKIGDHWVSPSRVEAVERVPGGGTRIYLKSGAQIGYTKKVSPDAVVKAMFDAEKRNYADVRG